MEKIPVIESFIAETHTDVIGFPEANLHQDRRDVTPHINGYSWVNSGSKGELERLSVLVKDRINYNVVNTTNTACNNIWLDFLCNGFKKLRIAFYLQRTTTNLWKQG